MSISAAASALASLTRTVASAPAGAPAKDKPAPQQPAAVDTSTTAYLQKNRLAELQARFRDKVMHQRNLSDGVMAQMTAKDRAAVEKSVSDEASRQLQSALKDMAAAGPGQNPPAQIVDVKA